MTGQWNYERNGEMSESANRTEAGRNALTMRLFLNPEYFQNIFRMGATPQLVCSRFADSYDDNNQIETGSRACNK